MATNILEHILYTLCLLHSQLHLVSELFSSCFLKKLPVPVDLVEEADGRFGAMKVHVRHVTVGQVGVLDGLHEVVLHELAQDVLKLWHLHLLDVVDLEVDLLKLVHEF
jgi:hypothetical protein